MTPTEMKNNDMGAFEPPLIYVLSWYGFVTYGEGRIGYGNVMVRYSYMLLYEVP